MRKLQAVCLAILMLVLSGLYMGVGRVQAHDAVEADTNDSAAQEPVYATTQVWSTDTPTDTFDLSVPLILSEPAQTDPPAPPEPPDTPDPDPLPPPDDLPEPDEPIQPPPDQDPPDAPTDPGAGPPPPPGDGPEPASPTGGGGQPGAALVVVTHLPRPSISVEPGGTLESVITIRNIGNANASYVVVTMLYDPDMLTVVTARFDLDDPDDETYVSVNDPGRLVIDVDSLGKGEQVVATIELEVSSSVEVGTPLLGRLDVDGSGINDDRDRTNLPMVVAGSSNQHTTIFALETPDASKPAGSTFTFASGAFHPYEPVTLWYHTPDGLDIEVGTVEANAAGEISVAFTSGSRMASGGYTMAANGNWSSIQAATPFIIE